MFVTLKNLCHYFTHELEVNDKNRSTHGIEPAWAYEMSCIFCEWQYLNIKVSEAFGDHEV